MARYTQTKISRLFKGHRHERNRKGNMVMISERWEVPLPAAGRKLVRLHPQMPKDTLVCSGQSINLKREFARQTNKPSWKKRISSRSLVK